MKRTALLLLVMTCLVNLGFAQTDSTAANDLEAQYLKLKDQSNNYQIYKVVKEASMDQFWNSVDDTLTENRTEIINLKSEVSSLNSEVSNLNNQVAERDANIETQAAQIENMDFLGMSMSKGSYVIMSWTLIFALIAVSLILFFRFKSANSTTTQAKKELGEVVEEFEAHKQRARENESKIKRDLQTEINLVEELKQKLGEA